jgi:hypothetical protein
MSGLRIRVVRATQPLGPAAGASGIAEIQWRLGSCGDLPPPDGIKRVDHPGFPLAAAAGPDARGRSGGLVVAEHLATEKEPERVE